MNRGKPVLVCATLALAAHATLLLGDGRTARGAATGTPPVSTRYLVESAEIAVAEPAPAVDDKAAADDAPPRAPPK